ncbi:MAG: TFIIB-type zinc ribbon-containing protein [Clostridia bacterium]
MAGVTYKCPSCGAYLTFDPDAQKWSCPFCHSAFEEDALLKKAAEYEKQAAAEPPKAVPTASGAQVIYNCPSCGSQIMTDETTVATQCYYCHNPVVLQGKLTSDMKPDSVLPFQIGKEKAVEAFMKWVKAKHFVPKGFFRESEVQSMSGVYYPHFVAACEVEGSIDGEGRNTSVVDTAKYIITNTQHYHVRRAGEMSFRNIMRPALQSTNRKLSDGIHPFPLDEVKPFSGAYLSGFLAERRDLDAASVTQDVEEEVTKYVEPLLADDLHYESYSVQPSATLKNFSTKYVLLPTWVLTYPNKKDAKDPYYYAMNGATGEVCGKLPINKGKLYAVGGAIAAAVFALGCLLSYFLF